MTGDGRGRSGGGPDWRADRGGDPTRLLDDDGTDSWVADLVGAARPYQTPAGRKQRVQLSLGRPGSRRTLLFLRPAVIAGVLIGCGAFASAAVGPWRGWIGRAYQRLVPVTASLARAERTRATGHLPAIVVTPAIALTGPPPARNEPPASPSLVAPEPTPVPATRPSNARALALAHPRHAAPPAEVEVTPTVAAPTRLPVAAETDTEMVMEAMRALRIDHDPARARALSNGYLVRHRGGALAEEALALTIEAAVAHHDGDAAMLGARYLQRYPAGPFRAVAVRATR